MKGIKKVLAVVLALVMVLSMAACTIHEKDEVAVIVDGEEFTTAYYMCALISAKSEAMGLVSEEDPSEDEKSGKKEIDYFSKKVEGKSFEEWVENRAVEIVSECAIYRKLVEKYDIKLTDEQKNEAQNSADILWYGDQSGQYQSSAEYFEMNGVSKKTYDKFSLDSYYAEAYFMYIYGEKGVEAISDKEIMKKISENFVLAQILTSTYGEKDTDKQKKAKKELLQANADYITKGEKTFVQAYKELNNISDDKEEHEEGDHIHPKYEYAQVLGAADTGYENQYFDFKKISKYKLGVPKVIDIGDGLGAALIIKRDITKDTYYIDNYELKDIARHLIADKDFEKHMEEQVKKAKVDVKSSIDRFGVKDIKTPEK